MVQGGIRRRLEEIGKSVEAGLVVIEKPIFVQGRVGTMKARGLLELLRQEKPMSRTDAREDKFDPYALDALARTEDPIEHEPVLPREAGRPGQSVDDAERDRVAGLDPVPLAVYAGHAGSSNPFRDTLPVKAIVDQALQRVVEPMRTEMRELRAAIEEQNRTLKTIDVPLETVANSHERAASSFETLRHDIDSISTRLAGVEGVIDTAGLMKAHGESARLLQEISREVREQLKVTRESLGEIVRVLAKINADAIEATRRAQERAAMKPREVVVIGGEGKDVADLSPAEKRKLRARLAPKKRAKK
jgi:hypothetical protein